MEKISITGLDLAKQVFQVHAADSKGRCGRKATADRATALSKTADQLTPIEKLDLGTVHFKKMMAHYQQGLGFVVSRLGKDGADADGVWKRLPEAKLYFATLLLLYPTDREGNIDKEGLKRGDWRLIPWRFGKNT